MRSDRFEDAKRLYNAVQRLSPHEIGTSQLRNTLADIVSWLPCEDREDLPSPTAVRRQYRRYELESLSSRLESYFSKKQV